MGETYITLFLQSPFAQADPIALLTMLLLFLARFLPIIAQAPFFGARLLPHPVKVTLAISEFIIFFPLLIQVTKTPIVFNLFSLLIFAKEVFVGFIIGFIISIPFIVVQSAGILIDHQRGGASLMVNDPTIQNQSSAIGTLFNFVLIYVFFLIDGPFLLMDALVTSYEIIPPDRFINPNFFLKSSSFGELQINLLNKAMIAAAQFASPALLTILMTETFLGIVNRLAPQVQVTFLGLPLKSLLGLGVVCIGWRLLVQKMVTESYSWLQVINEMLTFFNPGKI